MKPLEDAEAVELNEENDDEDVEDEDNYSEDSDSSDLWEGGYEIDSMYNEDQKNEMLWIVQQEKEAFEKAMAVINATNQSEDSDSTKMHDWGGGNW